MVYSERVLGMLTIFFLLMFVRTGTVSADFGYGDVYWLNEETGQWVKDIDGTWAALTKKGGAHTVLGNIGVSTSFSGAVIVDLDQTAISSITSLSLDGNGPVNSYEYISSDGIFSMKVTALSFEDESMIDTIWDPVKQHFLLVHERTVAKWLFTYKITNSLAVGIDVQSVQDNLEMN